MSKIKISLTTYPFEVLQDYRKVLDSIRDLDAITDDLMTSLDSIESEVEGINRAQVIAAFARCARARLLGLADASLTISEYCRAADVAREALITAGTVK